jgi:hypothetical protein
MTATATDPAATGAGDEALRQLEADAAAALDRGVVLSGRVFRRAAGTTVEQDVFTSSALRASGLRGILRRFDPLHDDIDDQISGVLLAAFRSGHAFQFLAGVLTEAGAEWATPAAEANARFFATRSDPADKAQIYELIQWVLLDFFLNADASWKVFLSYLLKSRPERVGDRDSVSSTALAGTPASMPSDPSLEDRSTAASGTMSSEHSPGTTSTGSA